jgi:hypothetical protein
LTRAMYFAEKKENARTIPLRTFFSWTTITSARKGGLAIS